MNLAYKYPIIFWNCACLINDSGGNDPEEIEETSVEEIEEDDDEEEIEEKKEKTKAVDYGKIATAIGTMQHEGISISPPDINKSSYSFTPDVENNTIIYGIKGINKVGAEIVKEIISNRPYISIEDFLFKVKINKPQMVNLIKCGAFDKFGNNRTEIMIKYIDLITEKKKRLTLQNMQMLIDKKILPEEFDFEIKVYNFNKYLKKFKVNDNYSLDSIAFNFYEKHFDMDSLWYENDLCLIEQKVWDKTYKKLMDPVREYLKENTEEVLNILNNKLFCENWDKYCIGTLSKWEMDSVSFYYHEHELSSCEEKKYDIVDYFSLSKEPMVDYTFTSKEGKEIPIYKISRIAGTILDKNKNKNMVTLLTNYGVVTVKIYQAQFAKYDKQISIKMPDGHKKVIEKSWLSRGNKVIFTGIRRDDQFVLKKYKNTPYSVIELITEIQDDGTLITITERAEEE